MHSKYIQQIMQNGAWESYRQQDTKLLQLKKQVKNEETPQCLGIGRAHS